jgi:two-component system response regulator YesN
MVDVFVGIGDVVYGETLLCKSFIYACEAVNYRLYNLPKKVQLYSEIPVCVTYEPVDFSTIIKSVENINSSEIITVFEKLINMSPSVQAILLIEQGYNELINTIEHQLISYTGSTTESLPRSTTFFELWSFLQLKQEIIKYLSRVQEFALSSKIDVSNKKLVLEVLQYVKGNVTSDINLNIVADKFDRTPAYMSTLFKKGTGMGFNEYITSIRMEMAKKMLKDTSIPVSQISSLCGYVNPKYFSVVFKSTFGKSPASYRQDS